MSYLVCGVGMLPMLQIWARGGRESRPQEVLTCFGLCKFFDLECTPPRRLTTICSLGRQATYRPIYLRDTHKQLRKGCNLSLFHNVIECYTTKCST